MQAVLLLAFFAAFGAGFGVAWWISTISSRSALNKARKEASSILHLAERESAILKTEIVENAKTKLAQERSEFDSRRITLEEERKAFEEDKQRQTQKNDRQRKKLNNRNRRLTKKQTLLLQATQTIDLLQAESEQTKQKAEDLHAEAARLFKTAAQRVAGLNARQEKLDRLIGDRVEKLEKIANLTQEEARQHMREELLEKAQQDISLKLLELREQAKAQAREESQKILLTTMQRLASDEAEAHSVSVVPIASDDVKGRIIGREGRNARSFEAATGVTLLIDDTPGAIVLSSFDQYRREIARLALTKLIQDGRIHPARIERFVKKSEKVISEEVRNIGERTILDLKLRGMHKELIPIIGKMKYRTSYSQNLLSHSIQVARLCSIMAAEMGLDPRIARRAGLLHDIGKVLTESTDRSHAIVGMEYCMRYKESDQICNAVGSHHEEIEMTSLYAPIVQVCDAISGARPGARHIRREEYAERLEDMESIALSFEGVTLAYAIQGGRELRVIVEYSKVSDQETRALADKISLRIQNELVYPGQVNVTVIRELRQTSVAK